MLNISRSGYYDWLGRPEPPRELRNKELVKVIREIHAGSRGSYGSPRVHAELRLGLGIEVNRKRVARLMRQDGIQGIYRRKGRRNPVNAATGEDLVRRQFTVEAPDRLWLADITEHPAADGKLYCAAVMDAYSRPSARTPISSSLPWPWQSPGGSRAVIPRSCIQTTERSILRGHSGSGSAMPGCLAPWAPSVIVTIMR